MKVDVLWVATRPEIRARGYHDCAFLDEGLLQRGAWTPSEPIEFIHHEVRDQQWPEVAGALVVLPARHHVGQEAWFVGQLDQLAWSVVLLVGDEAWEFDWAAVTETDTRRVWTMQPIAPQAHLSGFLPGGPYPMTHELLGQERLMADARPLDAFFAGQVTHQRRKECVAALRTLDPERTYIHETDGYLQGEPVETYMRRLAGAKVVPCPSGPEHVDTARPLEAMEAGCVPVVDTRTPKQNQAGYWDLVFGEGQPLRSISDWSTFPGVLAEELAVWPANANRIFAFWQGWKRRVAWQLDDDLRAVSRNPRTFDTPDDAVTVLVTTSPIPSHPSTAIITETIASVRSHLPRAEILIGIDGVRPEQEERRADYDEYTRRLLWLTNHEWHNVLPVRNDEWLHQAATTRRLLDLVRTPLVLYVEHDTPLVGDIEWAPICELIASGHANAVRFHHETTVLPDHRGVISSEVELARVRVGRNSWTVPLRQTSAFWQRPHLASVRFYRDKLMGLFAHDARTMIEDVAYGVMHTEITDDPAKWWDWRVYVYSPPQGEMKRSTHLDGRGADPKYPMWNT